MEKVYRFGYRWGYFFLIAVSVFIGIQIASNTPFRAHPDEIMHADAICYFESRWWPPPLNSEEILYSPAGWSRVYTGEVVYLLYGKISALIKPIAAKTFTPNTIIPLSHLFRHRIFLPLILYIPRCVMSYQIYRMLNVGLLLITLLVILLRGRRDALGVVFSLILLCIPQVLYIYAYANSDAWGLSISIFLFIFLLTTNAKVGSQRYAIVLALLVGLLLLSKESFWVSLSWGGILVGAQYFQQQKQNALKLSFRQITTSLVVFFVILLLMIAPLKLIYPITQGDWNTKVEEMKEIRSAIDAKPSNITRPGYRLAARHEPITIILLNRNWFEALMKSFYGVFGYFTVILPDWIYVSVLAIFVLNMGITVGTIWFKWSLLTIVTKALIICAPFSILLNIGAAIYSSWTYDFQPQGRYLFSSLIPLAVLLAGTVSAENKKCIAFRVISWLVCYGLCIYVLINYAM